MTTRKWCKSHRVFSHKCQRRTLWITWRDHIQNVQTSPHTQLYHVCLTGSREVGIPYSDTSQGYQTTVLSPAHQVLLRQVRQVELSVGRPPDAKWKRQPGRPRAMSTNQLRRDNNMSTTFPSRPSGGKPSVEVTRERRYGPRRLRVNDDNDDVVWQSLATVVLVSAAD